MMQWMEAVYDRTQADVVYAKTHASSSENLKGALNPSDLNRIESNCAYLAELLSSIGYETELATKSDWGALDFYYGAQLERIRGNVEILKEKVFANEIVPQSLTALSYININAIEKALNEVKFYTENMIAAYQYSGMFYSGEEVIL